MYRCTKYLRELLYRVESSRWMESEKLPGHNLQHTFLLFDCSFDVSSTRRPWCHFTLLIICNTEAFMPRDI